VTSDGGAAVTDRGVCWSTAPSPTTADPRTHDGTGTGNFVSRLSGLTKDTTYYVRAYATNSAGTAYGNQMEFRTLAVPPQPDYLAVLKNNGGTDNDLYVYTAPLGLQKGTLMATDSLSGDGNTVAIAGGDFDGDGVDEVAYLKKVAAGDYTLFVYTAPVGTQAGTLEGADLTNYDGSPVAIAALDIDGDRTDEIAVLKKVGAGDFDLYVFTAPQGVVEGTLKGLDRKCADGKAVAIAGVDIDGNGVDEVAVLKRVAARDFTLQVYTAPVGVQKGILKGTERLNYDGNTVAICGLDVDGDGTDEIAALKKASAADYNLFIYTAPVGTKRGTLKGTDRWSCDGNSRNIAAIKGL